MLTDGIVELDVRQNKIKEGYLIKRSRILKEWKKRWMVLTRTHLYSFETQGVYRDPTEKIPLKDVLTVKTYYKNQYERSNIIRIESDDTSFYLSAKDTQQKSSWMTAIDRTIDQISHPIQDSQNLIRQSLKMSTVLRQSAFSGANRQSTFVCEPRKSTINILPREIPSNLMTKIKICIDKKVFEQKYTPAICDISWQLQTLKHINLSSQQLQNKEIIQCLSDQKPLSKPDSSTTSETQSSPNSQLQYLQNANLTPLQPKIIEKIVQVRIPYQVRVEVERVVQVQKIVVVHQKDSYNGNLMELFTELISCKLDQPKPFIDFVCFLGMCGVQKYQSIAVDFCCQQDTHRFFSQLLLQALNEQSSQQRLNRYTSFIYIICQREPNYFYASDLRILMQIILRELQINRSQLNQLINLNLLRVLIAYHKNSFPHKLDELLVIVGQIKCLGSPQLREIGEQICVILH